MPSDVLHISPKVTLLPIIHGSGDFAIEVRRVMLSRRYDCLAVPLPPSFQRDVERAIEFLPGISAVTQAEPRQFTETDWSPESDRADEEMPENERVLSYVPVDPCQGVIAALRIAIGERIPRAFIDLETAEFEEPAGAVLPDPYAVRTVSADRFAAAVLPALPALPPGQPSDRVCVMARNLRRLEQRYQTILALCSITDWPWIREAYSNEAEPAVADESVDETALYGVEENTLLFFLGELPWITGSYEQARRNLDEDDNLSVDGIKEMLLAARKRYRDELKSRARTITPKMLAVYCQYVRNLALIERRMTPDLYTLVTAAQQIAGDRFALELMQTARSYPDTGRLPFPQLSMSVRQARLPGGELVAMKNRLPGHPLLWRRCELNPLPPQVQQQQWRSRWDPFGQCSWPPEDVAIERFRTHVKDVALSMMGADFARSEKFTTSLKDGLDIRETLRNWHTGDLFVKEYPPVRGSVDCVVMLFDSPADPRDYPWRITWHAEHHDESTLSLFATDFQEQLVGPGIAQAAYGGAMFLFPPRPIPDVWHDPRFDFTDTLEERLLAAACQYSTERHIALLSHAPPGAGWRRLAKRHGRKLLHVPLNRFSQQAIEQLRLFHVLNGQHIRSYAAHFIRKA